MKKLPFIAATLFLSSILATPQADAHGIWFAQRSTQLAMIYGVGADDLDMVKRKDLIKTIVGYDADWEPIATELVVAGPLVLVNSEGMPEVVAATMDNGIWSKTKEGEWVKKGRDEVPDAVTAEKTMKYAVHVSGNLTSKIPALPHQTLQIIPQVDALPESMGDELKLKVLFDGKPAVGAVIVRDFVNDPDSERVKPEAEQLKTDAEGNVTIQIRNQGLNVIGATFNGPADEPKKIDKIEHFATLSFVLKHLPE